MYMYAYVYIGYEYAVYPYAEVMTSTIFTTISNTTK